MNYEAFVMGRRGCGEMTISILISRLPLLIAPFILMMFSMISAYVLRFRLPRGGLGFDYIVFTIIVVVALRIGGAI